MKVTFWDGTIKNANSHEEAVAIVKDGLKAWMNDGDHIGWFKQPMDKELPSQAAVINGCGEETDAWAVIGK